MMKKTELLEPTRTAHEALMRALDGLTDEQAMRTKLTPQWSVKDGLAHITAWLIRGAEQWCDIQPGTWTPQQRNQEAIDRFNAEAIEKWHEHAMTAARAVPASAYEQTEQRMLSLPDEIDEYLSASSRVVPLCEAHGGPRGADRSMATKPEQRMR